MLRTIGYFALGAIVAFAVVVVVTGVPLDIPQEAAGDGGVQEDRPDQSNDGVAVAGPSPTGTPKQTPADAGSGIEPRELEFAIHREINEVREASGLDRLKMLPDLRTAARGHSRDMATNGFVGHTGSDGDGFEECYEEVGFTCNVEHPDQPGEYLVGAENVAYRTTTTTNETVIAERVVSDWMNSEGHRENILTEAWYREGIGVAVTSTGEVYVTQNFC